MMQIFVYREQFLNEVAKVFDLLEAESFFYLLLEQYNGMRRVDLALHRETVLSETEFEKFESAKQMLLNEIPIQYIIGTASFYGLDFFVNPSVLIPRPETEELVDWIVKSHEFSKPLHILDLCTGSGCIAISLAKNLKSSKVSALDVSLQALEVAMQNAERNSVSVDFIEQDLLDCEELKGRFDIIVSNPPYVRELEKAGMRNNVLANEPHLALFVSDDDALVFYRKIARLSATSLSENGALFLEINQYLGEETTAVLKANGFKNIELRKDIYGNDRMIRAFL